MRCRPTPALARLILSALAAMYFLRSAKLAAGNACLPISVEGASLIRPRNSRVFGLVRRHLGQRRCGGQADVVDQQRVPVRPLREGPAPCPVCRRHPRRFRRRPSGPSGLRSASAMSRAILSLRAPGGKRHDQHDGFFGISGMGCDGEAAGEQGSAGSGERASDGVMVVSVRRSKPARCCE